jgi:hypothetical protein
VPQHFAAVRGRVGDARNSAELGALRLVQWRHSVGVLVERVGVHQYHGRQRPRQLPAVGCQQVALACLLVVGVYVWADVGGGQEHEHEHEHDKHECEGECKSE